MNTDLDDPAVRRKFVGALLKLSPILFVCGVILAALQGASARAADHVAWKYIHRCM